MTREEIRCGWRPSIRPTISEEKGNSMTRDEMIELVMVHTSGSPQELEQVRKVLNTKSEEELQRMTQQIRLRVQTEETRRTYVELQIVKNGLANTDQNWQIINQRLPGERLTRENFRSLVESDSAFKQSLQWDAEPFAYAIREEQKQSSCYRVQRRLFDALANAVTGQGIVNVAANDANFAMISEALEEDGLDFTQDNVVNLLVRGGLELAPNDAETRKDLAGQSRRQLLETVESYLDHSPESFKIRQWAKDPSVPIAEIRERLQLVEQVAGTMSPHQQDRAHHFRKLVLSPYMTIESLRQQVADIDKRRELSSLSREELRQRIQREREAKQQSQQVTLPPEITAEVIRTSSAEQHRKWNKQYGHQLLDLRLQGVA
jgi:hypothetical protein